MKLAVNYSPQAVELLQTGQIKFDLFKTPNWHDMVNDAMDIKPVYVHFDLTTEDQRLSKVDWPEVDDFLARTGTEMVNLHIISSSDIDHCNQTLVENTLNAIIEDVALVCKRYGSDRVITENVPLQPGVSKYLRPVTMPAFFQRLVAETGCGMLLDLAHAAITARTLQTDPVEFFNEFPVRRLREIHITGLGLYEGEIHDHLELQDRDWQLFESAIDLIKTGVWREPDIAAFEYGGTGAPFVWRSESRVLLNQVPRLHQLVHNGNGKNPSR